MFQQMLGFLQKQGQPQQQLFFQPMKEKLESLEKSFNEMNNDLNYFQLKENIQQNIQALSISLEKVKVYITFMGTTSSGKSTLINSLLASQLLPSRNQQCTAQVIFIENSDSIKIENIQFEDLGEASKQLQLMQDNKNLKRISVQTPSYFHQQLNEDLRYKVVFVDTPGINISQCTLTDYMKHLRAIDELIELDEFSFRINVWISNYTTFDSEKELLQKLLIREEVDESNFLLDSIEKSKTVSSQLIQLKEKEIPILFVINKLDERKDSEDQKMETVISELSKIFNSDSLFSVSALFALRYNIMNFGSIDAQNKLIQQIYNDYRQVIPFTEFSSAQKYCQSIKQNHQLIRFQDYQRFIKQTILQIKNELNLQFYHNQLSEIIQGLTLLQIMNSKQRQQITITQKDQLLDLLSVFPLRIQQYEGELYRIQSLFIQSIKDSIKIAKKHISKKIIRQTCQCTLAEFHKLNQMLIQITLTIKNNLLDKFQNILEGDLEIDKNVEYIGPISNILNGCYHICQAFMDNNIYQHQKESFITYAKELDSKMGVKVNDLQRQMGYVATGMSLTAAIGSRFMVAMIATPALVLVGLSLLKFEIEYTDEELMIKNLGEWELSMEEQIKKLIQNYIYSYQQTLQGIYNLMEKLIY